jgi:hypothetical protein
MGLRLRERMAAGGGGEAGKHRSWPGILAVGCALGALSCSDSPSGPDAAPRTLVADGDTYVLYGEISDGEVQTLIDALADNATRIQAHLQVPMMPPLTIRIWASALSDDWYSTMRASLGTVYPGATGYLWGEAEMRLLFNAESPTEIVHEFAHLVSIQVNPTIPNNPRWLWEAIATYEAGQLDHPSGWTLAELSFPGFEALNQYNSPLPYRWGYLISAAIIDRWGDESYLDLIRTNGRAEETLEVTEAELGVYLEAYVRGLRN